MSNNAYLINSSSPTSDPAELQRLRGQPGHIDAVVAEGSNRLLIPWFLCFRRPDLRPVSSSPVPLQLPCTTVAQAVRNLEQSLPVFEAIAGDASLARPYWELACTLVGRLPLPYLALIPTEVMELDAEPEAFAAHVVGAMSGDLSAVPHLKALAEWNDGAPPYPLDVLYSVSIGIDRWAPRTWNMTVLDSGFVSFDYLNWNKSADAAAPRVTPVPESAYGELRDVADLLKAWVKAEVPSALGGGLGLAPGSPEKLFVQVSAMSEADAKQLEASASLRSRLDALARDRLEPWRTKHHFGWEGFRFKSMR